MASVTITTIQALIPQSGPRLRLVPCPFALQPNPASIRCVAEQALTIPPFFSIVYITTIRQRQTLDNH